jgi:DNA-binding winged helix-turn-helix (wHTH) protein
MPSGPVFGFGTYQLDARSRRLLSGGAPVDLSARQFDLLHALVAASGAVVSKDQLIEVAWQGVAVGDSSLEKLIFQLRQRLDAGDQHRYIRTVPRVGYQFVEQVTLVEAARVDANVHALLAPHRALIEGRAALETLERDRLAAARVTFEELVRHHPAEAIFHVGLAATCAFQFETTRSELDPDIEALRAAAAHAHEACRLEPNHAEAWATLGFVLERTGDRVDALAALQRAVSLEPDNWLHLFRQSAGNWGEARYRAARRTLAQYPGFPMAHWLAASVKVARGALDDAEREIDAARSAMAAEPHGRLRFSSVAIHWLKGLLCLARGDDAEAMAAFERELALEHRGHLYAKECCANASYAIGARHIRRNEPGAARAAFQEAIARIPRHPMARAGIAILSGDAATAPDSNQPLSIDGAMAHAGWLVAQGDTPSAADIVGAALAAAPPGNAGWLIPIDPLLGVRDAPDAWAVVLQQLRDRAA